MLAARRICVGAGHGLVGVDSGHDRLCGAGKCDGGVFIGGGREGRRCQQCGDGGGQEGGGAEDGGAGGVRHEANSGAARTRDRGAMQGRRRRCGFIPWPCVFYAWGPRRSRVPDLCLLKTLHIARHLLIRPSRQAGDKAWQGFVAHASPAGRCGNGLSVDPRNAVPRQVKPRQDQDGDWGGRVSDGGR